MNLVGGRNATLLNSTEGGATCLAGKAMAEEGEIWLFKLPIEVMSSVVTEYVSWRAEDKSSKVVSDDDELYLGGTGMLVICVDITEKSACLKSAECKGW